VSFSKVDSVDFVIEEGVRPLVEALNRLPYAATVYSCEGHFDRPANELFLPTAYVTFDCSDPIQFLPLYRSLLSLSRSCERGAIRLTYDCVLGRYTLSAWDTTGSDDARTKRENVSKLVQRISEAVRRHCGPGAETERDRGNLETHPCGYDVPPCALIIPQKALACPFLDIIAHQRSAPPDGT